MPAPEIIHQLVAKFTENREAYRSGKYNEAQLRQQFLDPFFEALGWDIYNRGGVAPEYQDVKIEDSLLIEGASKAPDYAFRIGKERKFYVEAKKPAVDIQYDIHPAYQLKRYAWNAHLPLSILTDFEELAVYNCKNKPNPTDSAATGRDLYFKYTDYVEKWDEIAAIFSKDAVWKGSFDRYAETSKGKKGTTEVDDAILESIESWRKLLALNIALRNPQVADEGQLNFAVQMTIDRILFLRICEDRGIEPEEQFKNMLAQPGIYVQMVELFKRADMKYNSGLFHFTTEKGTSVADTFTPGLSIDDKVLKEIIKDIYYPCPYIFKEIPVEILGQVYEQFLGKVIRLTAGHQAKVEEKPEVRKAGGVYYTPKYIVDYIVENTVGKLLEDKTPESAADLKIVDPACGSGSFLLGAYQHLLDWHLKWYTANDPEKWAKGKTPVLMAANRGGWKLTTAKKKEILVNNIHGVDIDAQAVEVTKLSLLLKVLEEESGQLSLGLERVLPDLGRNIQCGNSLIGEDYFEGQLVVDEKDRQRVNPFEWETSFRSILLKGGFDAVIGNPPWGAEFENSVKKYLVNKFPIVPSKIKDSYFYFIFNSIQVLKDKGKLSFILPNTWLLINNAKDIRHELLSYELDQVIDFGDGVFEQAIVASSLFILANTKSQTKKTLARRYFKNKLITDQLIDKENWLRSNEYRMNVDLTNTSLELLEKINLVSAPFMDDCTIIFGIKPYQLGYGIPPQTKQMMEKRIYHGNSKISDEWKPLLVGTDINSYTIHFPGNQYIKYGKWLMYSSNEEFMLKPKILLRRTSDKLRASIDRDKFYCQNSVFVINSEKINLEYLLGLLNSKLFVFLYQINNPQKGRIFAEIKPSVVKALPIRKINTSKPAEVKQHDRMVALVERMLELHKRTAQTPQEQERLTRDIASTDREIDKLVYELYGLSEEEIRIVEGG